MRNRKLMNKTAIILTLLLMCGCGNKTASADSSSSTTAATASEGTIDSQTISSSTEMNIDEMFTDRDKEIGYDESSSITIQLNGNSASCDLSGVQIAESTITIKEEGTYILSGSLNNGSVVVDADKTAKIQLVLNGVDIQCDTSAAIYVKQADKVFITLAKGTENKLSNANDFVAIDDNKIDAVIFSKDDLTLNGEGNLVIKAVYGHGVVSKDDLVITGGNYIIESKKHTLSGKDSVRIANGSFDFTAGTDGIHAENTEDPLLGFIYIADGNFKMEVQSDGMDASANIQMDGGTYEIKAADDGIHSDMTSFIKDGTIKIIESYEGIEGQCVEIAGGTIDIVSSDDGINAAGGNDQSGIGTGAEKESYKSSSNNYIKISGGKTTINASGDGVDANGNLYVSGGETYVSGSENNGNGALDYDGEATITGGIFIAAGLSGMTQNFGSSSTQGTILVHAITNQGKESKITIKDSDGTILASYEPPKQYNSVVISCPQIEVGKTYIVSMGTENMSVEMTGLIYGESAQRQGGKGMGGGKNRDGVNRNKGAQDGTTDSTTSDGIMPNGTLPEMPSDGTMSNGMPQEMSPDGIV